MLSVWERLTSYTKKGSGTHAHQGKFHLYALLYRGVEFKLNQFADLSEDEFRKYILMPPRGAPEFAQNVAK